MRLAERDERVVAITAAMTQGTGLEAFERRFPDRFYDVGIAEEHAAVFAAGLAIGGMRPVVALYSTFLQRAFDMLVQDIGLQHLPVTFAVDRAGLVGDDGPTHHGAFDLSFLRVIPGMTRDGAVQPGGAPAHAGHGAHAGRPGGAALPARPRRALQRRSTSSSRSRWGAAWCSRRAPTWRSSASAPASASPARRPSCSPRRASRRRWSTPASSSRWTRSCCERLAAGHRRLVTVEENALRRRASAAPSSRRSGSAVEVVRFGLPDAFVPHGDRTRVLADIGLTPQAVALAARAHSPALTRVK